MNYNYICCTHNLSYVNIDEELCIKSSHSFYMWVIALTWSATEFVFQCKWSYTYSMFSCSWLFCICIIWTDFVDLQVFPMPHNKLVLQGPRFQCPTIFNLVFLGCHLLKTRLHMFLAQVWGVSKWNQRRSIRNVPFEELEISSPNKTLKNLPRTTPSEVLGWWQKSNWISWSLQKQKEQRIKVNNMWIWML